MSTYQSQFAPYAPPPDDRNYREQQPSSQSSSKFKRPWFPSHTWSQHAISSYQSGGVPTFNNSQSGGTGSAAEAEAQTNQWETRFGMRVDALAGFAYILGPISAFMLLVTETQNDYVRFHAYQSALLTTPLLGVRFLASVAHFPGWMKFFFTLLLVIPSLFMAFCAFRDANRNGLSRYELPFIGKLADEWVAEE